MQRLINFQLLYVLTFLQVCCILCLESSSCYHDSIAMHSVPKSFINYVHRGKRDIEDNYVPLKIYLHLTNESFNQEIEEIASLILHKAINDVSKIFSVKRVSGDTLLLKRNACARKWMLGKNKGRCSRLKYNYVDEFCENKIDKFQIPSDFLAGLPVYDFRSNTSSFSINAGSGAKNSSYILFVTAKSTIACEKSNIKAYGSYCQVDQFNRPIAGIINFCPQYLKKQNFEENYFLKVVLHEIFHVLGFSKNLFPKFNLCSPEDSSCEVKKNTVVTDSSSIPRFVLPNVVKQMQLHFNCGDSDFGGPLEQDIYGNHQSHWDPLLMYGSIMSPKLLDPEYVFVDPITLAYFADTGWYKVNFSYAADYYWGKDEGCNFGSNETCERSPYLCIGSNNSAVEGCDFLHFTKSKCQSVAPYHLCGVFPPNKSDICYDPDLSYSISTRFPYDEGFGCFLTKKGDSNIPKCRNYKCSADGHSYNVRINNSSITCLKNESKQKKNTLIVCPRNTTFCPSRDHLSETMFIFDSIDPRKCPFESDNYVIKLQMSLVEPHVKELMNKTDLSMLKADTLKALSLSMNVSLKHMVNCTLKLFRDAVLDVKICLTNDNQNNEEIKGVIKNVFRFTQIGMFSFIVDHGDPVAIVIMKVENNPKEVLTLFDYEGYKILICIPAAILVFIIALCSTQLVRLFIIKHHHPHRETEKEIEKHGRSFRESVARMSLVFKSIY